MLGSELGNLTAPREFCREGLGPGAAVGGRVSQLAGRGWSNRMEAGPEGDEPRGGRGAKESPEVPVQPEQRGHSLAGVKIGEVAPPEAPKSLSSFATPAEGPPGAGGAVWRPAARRVTQREDGESATSPGKSFELLGTKVSFDENWNFSLEIARPSPVFEGKHVGSEALQAMYRHGLTKTIEIFPSGGGWGTEIGLGLLGKSVGLSFKPEGHITLGGHLGLTKLAKTKTSEEVVETRAEAEFGGGVVADFAMQVGTASGVVDVSVRGGGSASAVMVAPKAEGVVKLYFESDVSSGERVFSGYELALDSHPAATLALEATSSLVVKYLGGYLGKQEIFVLYLKGMRLDVDGDLGVNAEGKAESLLPSFTPEVEGWSFTTKDKPKEEPQPLGVEPGKLAEAFAETEELATKLKEKLPPEATEKPTSQVESKPQGAPEKEKSIESVGTGGKLELFSQDLLDTILKGYNNWHKQTWGEWLWSWGKAGAEQTALTSLKQKLIDGQFQWLLQWLTSTLVGKTYGFGKAINLEMAALTLTPGGGLRLNVKPSISVFGSKFESSGDFLMQWDLFHRHAWHYEVDFEAESWTPRKVAPWRVHADDVRLAVGKQLLVLNGIGVEGDDFRVARGTLDLTLPNALGAPPIRLTVQDLRIGDDVTWGLLGGETRDELSLGQRVKIKSLAIGGRKQDETKLFGRAAVEVQAFKELISGDVMLAWHPTTGEFYGAVKDLDFAGQSLTVGFSKHGIYFEEIDLDLLKVLEAVPGADVVPLDGLKVQFVGLAIQRDRIALEEARASATLKPIDWGPLSLTDATLRLIVGEDRATGFEAAGKVGLNLWGKDSVRFAGQIAFAGASLDKENTKITAAALDLVVLQLTAEQIAPLDEGGFEITKPQIKLAFDQLGTIKGLADSLPSWLTGLKDFQVVVLAAKYNSKTGLEGIKILPALITVPLGTDKIARFGFDGEKALIELPGLSYEWSASIGTQVPLLYGLAGVEVRGKVNLGVGLKETKIEGAYKGKVEPPYATLDGSLAAFLATGAEIQAGLFAGIPHALSVSGGLFAEIVANADIVTAVTGRFELSDEKDYTLGLGLDASARIRAGAGAYIAYMVLGYRGDKKFPIAEKDLASVAMKGTVTYDGEKWSGFDPEITASSLLQNEGPKEDLLKAEIAKGEEQVGLLSAEISARESLLALTKGTEKEELKETMKTKAAALSDRIKKGDDDPATIARLKEALKVWEVGLLVPTPTTSSVSERLVKSRKRLYEETMKLLKAKTVGYAELRAFTGDQLAAAQDAVMELEREAKEFTEETEASQRKANADSQAKARAKVTELQELLSRSSELADPFQLGEEETRNLEKALKENPELMKDAETAYGNAQDKHRKAMEEIGKLLKEQLEAQEQSGALTVKTSEELRQAEEGMKAFRLRWYSERSSIARRVLGLSTSSRKDAAIKALESAEIELDFAERQLELTKKLSGAT